MVQCKHRPPSSADGVCPSCLQKKLKSVRWREPGGSLDDPALPSAPGATVAKPKSSVDPVHPKEAIAILGSIASIKKRNQRGIHPGRDITEAGLNFVLDSRYADRVPSHRFQAPSAAHHGKDRKRWLDAATKPSAVGQSLALQDSKPLVDRLAKETALRVIREVTDEVSVAGEGEAEGNGKATSSFFRPSHLLSKWGRKGMGGSPSMTSSNKVFPSKPAAEMRSTQTQFSPAREQSRVHILATAGADLQLTSGDRIRSAGAPKAAKPGLVIVGMPDRIMKPEDMNQRLRTSTNTVLQWLEDLPVPETLLKVGVPHRNSHLKESRTVERYQPDLAVVGHLHEIAEEHEILGDESSVESEPAFGVSGTGNHLNEVSSFGKFLIRAAQRQPKQGLSRVQARATTLTAR